MKENKSILFVLVSAVFAITIIFVGWRYSTARILESENGVTNTTLEKTSDETYENLLIQINQLYTSEDRVYLKKDSSVAIIKELKVAVESSSKIEKKEELLAILQTALAKREIEDELNKLFDRPKISGGVVNSEDEMKAEVSDAEISKIENLINQSDITDDFSKQVLLALGRDVSSKTSIVSEDDNRYVAAKEALAVIVQNGQPVLGFTWEQYETAKNAIAEVPASTQKEELLSELKIVQDVLISMGMST